MRHEAVPGDEGVLVRSTYATEEDAWEAARRVVEGRLAACAHVQPIRSCYVWKEKLEEQQEWSLEARTSLRLGDALAQALAARHPYDVPMVESWRVALSKEYAAWVREAT